MDFECVCRWLDFNRGSLLQHRIMWSSWQLPKNKRKKGICDCECYIANQGDVWREAHLAGDK